MQILSVTIKDILGVSFAHLEPDGALVEISGKNSAGKSSLINAIWLAIGGRAASKAFPDPIREGEPRGRVSIDFGEFQVVKTWEAGRDAQLTVTEPDGTVYSSPQALLTGFFGNLTFDPMALLAMKPKEQVELLLGLVDIGFDLVAADERKKTIEKELRPLANREKQRVAGHLATIPEPAADLPETEVSLADLLTEHSAGEDERRSNAVLRDRLAQFERDLTVNEAASASLAERIAALQAEAGDLTAQHETLIDDIGRLRPTVEALVDPDLAELTERMSNVEATNASIRAAADRRAAEAALAEAEAVWDELDTEVKKIDADRRAAIDAAQMPLDGLSFTEDELIFEGHTLATCATNEQIRVAFALAMALNPGMEIVFIRDGSMLDSERMALVAEMAADAGFQLWIETVDSDSPVAFTIVEGQLGEPEDAQPHLADTDGDEA